MKSANLVLVVPPRLPFRSKMTALGVYVGCPCTKHVKISEFFSSSTDMCGASKGEVYLEVFTNTEGDVRINLTFFGAACLC